MEGIYVFLGFIVGFLVGLTGIGGGALMTPSLIFLGMTPLRAVGTDLLFVTATKVFGTAFHHKMGRIRYDIALRLIAGSLPAIAIGGLLLRVIDKNILNAHLTLLLGIVLLLSAVISLIKKEIKPPIRPRMSYLYILGFVVGLTVQFTSVGAGVIVSFTLINLARISPAEVVGISLFYGLLLSSMSFLNYALMGSVDYGIALTLILGSIFGVLAGTRISTRVESEKLKKMINLIIAAIGAIILLKHVL
ncbi:Sulfite exporter TauE/SafE [Geoglobus ahangari]|uniref:Probable membrane transporter protein n=1 Tax=Geoglobus ahangari TaxID=113653 RepID=A0A0F7IGY8_9EURY|nr:sulfite exporter TauE/SafE family protein [Geoglobus ahangari]AKG91232.1 Sulfite exporter TauE/SafE [Geoglobus ahangari]